MSATETLPNLMPRIEILPNLKKRLILLALIIAFGIGVVVIAPFPSNSFILYFGLCFVAFCYMTVRLFNRKPLLTLSEAGILSSMTTNGDKMGLIPWPDVREIRETRLFWVIRGIELHTTEEITEKYKSRVNKKERSTGKTFLINLTSEEINMKHRDLFLLVNQYWTTYK